MHPDPLADLTDDALEAMLEALAIAVTADRVVNEFELRHYDALLEEVLPNSPRAHELSKAAFDAAAVLPHVDFAKRIGELAVRIPPRLRQEVFRRIVRIAAADGKIVPIEDEVIERFGDALGLDEDAEGYLFESETHEIDVGDL